MKRLPQCLLALLLLINIPAWAADIFVSTAGSDLNDGSKEKPLATLAAALRKARNMRRLNVASVKNGIHIILAGSVYQTLQTIIIRPEDSGTLESPTIIEAAPNEKPIISGGVQINSWKKLTGTVAGLQKKIQTNIWVAEMPAINGSNFNCRQLWVNDTKATRAKSANGELMHRIISWNKQEQTCMIPTLKFNNLENEIGIEMFIHQWWEIANLRIKKMKVMGDSTKLFFQQPESKIQSEHPWPAPWISKETGNSAFYLANAIQFLDEPGEWYLDVVKQKIYYYPRPNENMTTANVVAAFTETLVKINGNESASVANIYFKGISFMHTGWLRPSMYGHVPHQIGMYMTEAYKLRPAGTADKNTLDNQAWIGRPAAAVEINYADNTLFEKCNFMHLASSGLDFNVGTHNNIASGNLFKDIGGTALLAGFYSNETTEIHLPYNPKNENEVCNNLLVKNNLITNVANEDWGCVGIGLGYTKNSKVEHNEIENVSYTGISIGWGWTATANAMKNNSIIANKIHHFGKHNYDCAGIYTLSAQPNTIISENDIDSVVKAAYAHLPSHWFYIYTDEGSSYFTVKNNWTASQKYLQNANGPGNDWTNNGPQVDIEIKENAGLQKAYQYLLKEKATDFNTFPINEERNEVLELVTNNNERLDVQKLKNILLQNNMDTAAIYQWQNHTVYFGKVQDVTVMLGRLKNNFPTADVKVYFDVVYDFQKRKYCADKTVAKEWDHIVLTANLVADEKMQQAYVAAHSTQFERIPQIAQGFCNANFQQLLVYKNGRQLMLIISIPKGESLDNLNPKTTENNPQMIEWNKQMAKYQEGIEGTKKGETWVFLKNISNP